MIPVGALEPSHVDAAVAAHYGDPNREQRLLAESVGLVNRSNRGVIVIPGPDRHEWLHSFTSQHLSQLAPMTGTELLVLSPHGHIEHHAAALEDGTAVYLDVEPGTVEALLKFLLMMRFRSDVEPVDGSPQWALLSLVGPQAEDLLDGLAAPVVAPVPGPKFAAGTVPSGPSTRYSVAAWPGGGYVRRMSYGADLIVPRSTVDSVVPDVPRAGIWAFEALRVADRRPRFGFETDHRTLPAEVGWVASAVHLDKGCYRGQETVARLHNLGQPPRRLVLLHLDGMTTDELPATGASVSTVDGRAVGFVGTAARHYELGPIALALVKRSVPDDAALRVGPSAAAIEPL
jgi:folate-binding protein YgfZ